MPWPVLGGRGVHSDGYPDCRSGGPHRFGKAHPWPVDESVFYQTCRRCGDVQLTKIEIVNGSPKKRVFLPSGSKTDRVIDDKHSPYSGGDE